MGVDPIVNLEVIGVPVLGRGLVRAAAVALSLPAQMLVLPQVDIFEVFVVAAGLQNAIRQGAPEILMAQRALRLPRRRHGLTGLPGRQLLGVSTLDGLALVGVV